MDKKIMNMAKQIANYIKKEELCLFFGSGITTVHWNNLYENNYSSTIPNYSNYLKMQMIRNEFTDESDFLRKIKDIISRSSLNGNYLNELLNFNIKHIWTTNYDNNIELILNKSNILYDKIYKEEQLKNMETIERRVLYKINGDIDDLQNAVITQEQYEKQQERMNLFSSFLEKELLIKKFLIIGYSFSDNIFLKSIAKLNNYFNNATNICFNITDEESFKKQEWFFRDLENRYNIKSIVLKSYDDIEEFILKIKYFCNKDNIYISGSKNLERSRNDKVLIKEVSNFFLSLFKSNFKIYSNHGEFLGYHLGASATQFSHTTGMSLSEYVNIVPIYSNDDSKRYREETIKNTKITILMYGDNDNLSSGILEEFFISYENDNLIFPLFFTGKTPKIIYEFMLKHKLYFSELDPYWDDLNKIYDLNTAYKTICNIISHINEHYSDIKRNKNVIKDIFYKFIEDLNNDLE